MISRKSHRNNTTAVTIEQARAWYFALQGTPVEGQNIPEELWKRTVMFSKVMTFDEFLRFNQINTYEEVVR